MKKSIHLSLALLLVVAVWMLSGALAKAPEVGPVTQPVNRSFEQMKVAVLQSEASEVSREIVLQGELEPRRQVEIRAQTASQVTGLPIVKGKQVAAGTLIIELAAEDRRAQLQRAQAEVRSQKLEVDGARKLEQKGLQAETRVKAAEAALATARADLEKARLELDYTHIKAPFAGVLEQRHVELGSHLEIGDRVALLVDASLLKAVGRVSQPSAGSLRLGQPVHVKLLDGREAQGRLSYVARVGDTETHSFRVEAEIPNAEGLLNAGVSAELRIQIGREPAHFLSPAVLALDARGAVGVKTVTKAGVVQFQEVSLVRTEADGIWVTGLPSRVQVITQGQGFVGSGEAVTPVPAG